MSNTELFISVEEGQLLVRIARECLTAYLSGSTRSVEEYPLTPRLREKHGCFVTVRCGGALRGCIGHIRGMLGLAEAVRDNAVSAATRDPRFDPLTLAEMPRVEIEVSVLLPGEEPESPFIPVANISEIVVGRDGLYLDHAGPRGGGLLLPHVAVEQGWTTEQFLSGLCRKSGVADDFWRHPEVNLFRFSTQTFHQ